MELHQLRCFVAAAEELHFGRAAQRLEMLPSALGRHIRLLEDDLGTRLMTRTTRSVTLTDDGAVLLKDARDLLAQADGLAVKFHARGRKQAATIRLGAIDSAAAGLLGIRQAGDTDATIAAALSRVQDAFLFGGYVIAAIAVGTLLLYRRDPS